MAAENPRLQNLQEQLQSQNQKIQELSLTLHKVEERMNQMMEMMRASQENERRQAEVARYREKYPDKIRVIVEKAGRSDVPDIDKKKYLVSADSTVGQFVHVIRERIKLGAEKAIFVHIKNILTPIGE
ncbi:autophagy-related protein 8C-like isoform X2 [Hevea brasiliensis]|uniref:autophagy-related protein 8C-like isoform X2 n=1 Tax=Hevea brasiliensis TaxID=3981 RepID=UPI0025FF94DF|nr:autophagy-related protein 8C-like isoform X2 [Hevea brasiliensis]